MTETHQNSLYEQFSIELQSLGGKAHLTKLSGLSEIVAKEALRLDLKMIAACVTEEKIRDSLLKFPKFTNWNWLHSSAVQQEIRKDPAKYFDQMSAGVLSADYFIASTATAVVGSVNSVSKLISLIPPVIILIGWLKHLVPDLNALMRRLEQEQLQPRDWHHLTFITGPSRTADIEKKLILGVHGPKEVICILVE